MEIEPTSLRETLDALLRTQPDIIVLDYLMPNFNGDALIRALRAEAPEPLRSIPILVVSVEVLIGAEGHFSFADGRIDWG